jgi:hypothetical protein
MKAVATMTATSIRKMAMENVPRDNWAQARRSRLVGAGDASVKLGCTFINAAASLLSQGDARRTDLAQRSTPSGYIARSMPMTQSWTRVARGHNNIAPPPAVLRLIGVWP